MIAPQPYYPYGKPPTLFNVYVLDAKDARGVMVKVMGNGLVDPSSNPGRGNCISLRAIPLGKV